VSGGGLGKSHRRVLKREKDDLNLGGHGSKGHAEAPKGGKSVGQKGRREKIERCIRNAGGGVGRGKRKVAVLEGGGVNSMQREEAARGKTREKESPMGGPGRKGV